MSASCTISLNRPQRYANVDCVTFMVEQLVTRNTLITIYNEQNYRSSCNVERVSVKKLCKCVVSPTKNTRTNLAVQFQVQLVLTMYFHQQVASVQPSLFHKTIHLISLWFCCKRMWTKPNVSGLLGLLAYFTVI